MCIRDRHDRRGGACLVNFSVLGSRTEKSSDLVPFRCVLVCVKKHWFFFKDIFKAVSYTHLDVYKRQRNSSGGEIVCVEE